MKNASAWKPTKAEFYRGGWRASRDANQVGVGSRAIADWLIAAYAKALLANARGVLVDVGCGNQPYYGIYKSLVTDVIAVDWLCSQHENPHLDVSCDLNESIDLPTGSVDTVLCTDVLEHIYRPYKLWQEINRVLKPGGVGIIATPFLYWIHEAPHDYHRYTKYALERYAADAQLDVLHIEIIGGLPHVVTDMMCKVTARVRIVAESIRLIANWLLRIPAIRRIGDISAARFPLAYLMIVTKSTADQW